MATKTIRVALAVATCLWLGSSAADEFALQKAEFAKYYHAITGKDAPEGTVRFAIDSKVSKSGRDAYEIVSGGRASPRAAVTITGSNLRSVWYGLYDLLERRGGCHWFWDGDVVPKKDSIDLFGLDIHEEAHFEYRAIRYFAHRGLTRFQAEHWGPDDWKREIDWLLKKRLNVFMLRIGQDDLFQRAFPEACKYPDPAKRLPGAGSSYNDRTLFWSLQYRGELRRRIQKYGFDRGLLAPEDFGTMTHWYSRTPEDWLANKNPQFLPQASGSAAGRNGLVWDIRDDKWVDAYWKLTTTAVEQYGAGAPKPQLLHTIGLSERNCYKERKKNFDLKIEALNKFFTRAQRDYPDAKLLLSGWDFYGGWKAEDVRAFLPTLDKNRVILWDYEADCQEDRSTFVDWDVIGKFPYTYSTILAFEAALDARADYPFIEKRQRLVQNDPMCVGWVHWPESAHTDTLFLDFFTANAWSDKPIPHGEVLDDFCKGRYGKNAELMKSVWADVLDASALRRWDEYSESNLNCAQHLVYHGILKKGYEKRPAQWGPPIAKAMAALRRLEDAPWDDEFVRRDAIDITRMVLDRLIVLKIDELGSAVAAWRGDGKCKVESVKCKVVDEELVARARELAALFDRLADVLELHTDYSLWESYQRLDAIEKIQNPDFTKTLFENAVNQYCLSHQYEAIRYVVAPAMAELAERIAKAVKSGDRKVGFSVHPRFGAIRKAAKAKPLESLKPTLPRTAESFRKVLGEVLKLVKADTVPSTVCQRATCPVKVDGVLDEEVWRLAKPLSPMRDLGGGSSEFGADIRMVYDDRFLYISATLPAKTLRATLTKRDSVIFHDDDFEVFIDPDATGRNYLELEINQLNTVWDLFLTAPYGHPLCKALHDWDIKGLRTAVTLQGTLNDGEGDDTSWTVEIAWPWESITGHSAMPRRGAPPPPGTVMRMNFSRVDHVDGVEHNTVWAPTRLKTIHAPERWGRVRMSANPVGTPERPDPTVGLWVHGNDASVTAKIVSAWADAGVTTLIIDGSPDSIARVSKLGKAAGLRTVAWFWTLNRPGDREALAHPQWYATSAQGRSCHDPKDRPFVSYYQFLCPSNPEVLEHLRRKVLEVAAIPEVDAVQMDYIRMPDAVLPKALWPKYGLDMSNILPQFDFCYCAGCKARFGREPNASDAKWTEWRLDCVARAANSVADVVRAAGKPCGAAVFPTPRMSAEMVRQDWSRFKLDFAFPMDYASFYGEGCDWILACISEARKSVDGKFPIFPGLYLHDFTPAELEAVLRRIHDANPEGFCLFAHDGLTQGRLAALRRILRAVPDA